MADDPDFRRYTPPRPVWVLDGGVWHAGRQRAWVREARGWVAMVEFAGRYRGVVADRVQERDDRVTPPPAAPG